MIPSDHFVRYYNEVFKALHRRGKKELVAYWKELGRVQTEELGERFRNGGLKECYKYWQMIKEEENCDLEITLTDEYLEMVMHKCPSLSKVLDNDAEPSLLYCDHCMGWIEPVMEYAGLYAVQDMESRKEPHCRLRVYTDKAKAEDFSKTVLLLSHPYRE